MGLASTLYGWAKGPGSSHTGPLPPLTSRERNLSEQLRADVTTLARDIGERNYRRPAQLAAAMQFIEGRFRSFGYSPERETFVAGGHDFANVVVELPGGSPGADIVVVGAHYDSAIDCPAANDNGSGVAVLLALAERFAHARVEKRLRFVAFTNEEPPFSFGVHMGSHVHARKAQHRGERIAAMISLETMGYYSDEPGSQVYPPPVGLLYPSVGNFIGFVSNLRSKPLLERALRSFRSNVSFPSEGAALPSMVPGVGWSDHWSFWQFGYPAIMVTDTAPFRYPHYHRATDTPDKLDYERLARVARGMEFVVVELTS